MISFGANLEVVSVSTLLINVALIGTLFIDTQKQLIHFICHPKKRYPIFITESLRPQAAIFLKIASLVFVSFQSMAAIQISKDYLSDQKLVIPNACILWMAFTGSAYYPLRQLTDWALQELLLKYGKPHEKEIIPLFQKVETIKELIKAS